MYVYMYVCCVCVCTCVAHGRDVATCCHITSEDKCPCSQIFFLIYKKNLIYIISYSSWDVCCHIVSEDKCPCSQKKKILYASYHICSSWDVLPYRLRRQRPCSPKKKILYIHRTLHHIYNIHNIIHIIKKSYTYTYIISYA